MGGSTASDLAKVVPALGAARLDGKCRGLDDYCRANNMECGMVRVLPRASEDVFAMFDWVPQDLRGKQELPENTLSFGAPWLFANACAAPRTGHTVWPVPGIGQFLFQLVGPALFVAWPISWAAKINVTMEDTWSFTAAMQPKQFDAFWSNTFHCVLEATEAMWIPYGWTAVMVGLGDGTPHGGHAKTLMVPYANTQMLRRLCPGSALASMIASMEDLQRRNVADVLHKSAPAFAEWLRAALPSADAATMSGGSASGAGKEPRAARAASSAGGGGLGALALARVKKTKSLPPDSVPAAQPSPPETCAQPVPTSPASGGTPAPEEHAPAEEETALESTVVEAEVAKVGGDEGDHPDID